MSFAILGASAALVPNRVRVAKSVNNTRVSTVTVAVRHAVPRFTRPRFQSQYRHESRSRYLHRLVSVPLAPLETRVSTEGCRALFLDRPKTDVARAIRFFWIISLSS